MLLWIARLRIEADTVEFARRKLGLDAEAVAHFRREVMRA